MGERFNIFCREFARPSTHSQPDDGTITLATSVAKGAHRVSRVVVAAPPALDLDVVVSGHAGANEEALPAALLDTRRQLQDYEQMSENEDDPFGHALLGFDDNPPFAPCADVPLSSILGLGELATLPSLAGHQRSAGAHASHALGKTGHVVSCKHCGRHAAVRHGVSLIRHFRGTAGGVHPSCIQRLRLGRHPVSGDVL